MLFFPYALTETVRRPESGSGVWSADICLGDQYQFETVMQVSRSAIVNDAQFV